MDKLNNYWNIFASTGSIDDYMTYKKIEKLDKINATSKIESVDSIQNNKKTL